MIGRNREDIPGAPRCLTVGEAEAIYDLLVEEAGARDDEHHRERWSFVRYASGQAEWNRIFVEWRFQGSLGFGGKLKFDGFCVPYVTCYREHETPERLAVIGCTNARLAAIFVISEPAQAPEGTELATRSDTNQREDARG